MGLPSTYQQVVENANKLAEHTTSINSLASIVGDASSGLVSEVNKLDLTIYGDGTAANPGLADKVEDIASAMDAIEESVDEINETIFNDDPTTEGNSDIHFDPETGEMCVTNITIITENAGVNSQPSAYERDITYEFKLASAVGLSGYDGITATHVLIITHCCTDSSINYPVWQAAIGDSEMKMYQRVATSASVWGAWTPVSGDSHRQIVDSDTQPSGQEVGDYWLETITE